MIAPDTDVKWTEKLISLLPELKTEKMLLMSLSNCRAIRKRIGRNL